MKKNCVGVCEKVISFVSHVQFRLALRIHTVLHKIYVHFNHIVFSIIIITYYTLLS